MKVNVVFENRDIIVVDKPAGLVVNRSETIKEETFQDQLSKYFHLTNLGIGGRAGIVHRLDRETSGLLIVARRQKVFDFLQRQFKERKIKKGYLALVHGYVKESRGLISSDIGRIGRFGKFGPVKEGRESATHYQVIKRYKFTDYKFEKILTSEQFTKSRVNYLKKHGRFYTYIKLQPLTGRTHQIRVHIKSIGHPVVSDSIYTPSKLFKFDLIWCPRLFLHSSSIEFRLYKSKKPLKFVSDLPNDLKNAILYLAA